MAATNIAQGSPGTGAKIGAALFIQQQQRTGTFDNLIGAKPSDGTSLAKLEGQTSADMPIIEVLDLNKFKSDAVQIDCMDVINVQPIMGDRNLEGMGAAMSMQTFRTNINAYSYVVDGGGLTAQQRTPHDLAKTAIGQAKGLMSKFSELNSLVHLAGARGDLVGGAWDVLPLAAAANFAEVMINPVQAPTRNRHYVVSGANIVAGGEALANVLPTDTLTLNHIDQMRNVIDSLELTLQSVKLPGDKAATDEPMWLMFAPPAVYSQLLQSGQMRAFQQFAEQRRTLGVTHPLFAGEIGMWNGILVKKLPRAIQFNPGSSVMHVAAANAQSGIETPVVVSPALPATHAVQRCILLGAQALVKAYGNNNNSGSPYIFREKKINFETRSEFALMAMGGTAKVRFNSVDRNGLSVPTDHGVMVLDVVARV